MAGAIKYAYRVIVDGIEKVALTEISDVCQMTFDYSEIIVKDYVEVQVIAYNVLGESKTAVYRKSFYSGTY